MSDIRVSQAGIPAVSVKPSALSFNKLNPVKFWEASIRIHGLDEDQVIEVLKKTSAELNFNFFGFLQKNPDSSLSYSFTRYPRKKYGTIPNDDQCRTALNALSHNLKALGHEVVAEETSFKCNGYKFRTVFGLEKGYNTGIFHELSSVNSKLGQGFKLSPIKILTVKDIGKTCYREPAVLVESNTLEKQIHEDRIKTVMHTASELDQERLTVEELSPANQAYIIETPKCKSSDNEEKQPLEV